MAILSATCMMLCIKSHFTPHEKPCHAIMKPIPVKVDVQMQSRMKYLMLTGPLLATLLPYVIYEYLRRHDRWDIQWVIPNGHFYIVSLVSILAAVLGLAVGMSAVQLRNIKVSFLALAFISLGGIFAVHGLSTPGFLLPSSPLPGVAAQLSILLAVCWLFLSSMPSDHKVIVFLSRRQKGLIPVWIALLLVFAGVSMTFPGLMRFIPLDQNPLKWAITVVAIGLNLAAMYRYYQAYLYSRFPLQMAIIYSLGWLMVSQWIMVTGEVWRLSWWLYHFLFLSATIVMLIGLLLQYSERRSLKDVVHGLYTSDPVERISSSISPSIRALILATETKDTYTAGHNLRVSLYALSLAEQLRLKPLQLRALAQGAIVHDVGKINISDAILNKPGKLTVEERKIIETHPLKGYDMCRNLGFMKEELDIIRSHHEKWDGTGYPDRLSGEAIPLLARIAAVADVYDSLTSNRAYRKAWTHQEAMALLETEKGSHFDPRCVEAWVALCKRDSEVYQYPLNVIHGNGRNILSPLWEKEKNQST